MYRRTSWTGWRRRPASTTGSTCSSSRTTGRSTLTYRSFRPGSHEVGPANSPVWVLERNPYSIWVDTEGNQLPVHRQDPVHAGREPGSAQPARHRRRVRLAGAPHRHRQAAGLPGEPAEGQLQGAVLDPATTAPTAAIHVNLSYEADPEIAKWISNVEFRRAISLGIDRDQLNETFWLGMGTPELSVAPSRPNKYSPGPE